MAWQLYDTEIMGNESQVLLDDSFVGDLPAGQLPNLAWLGLWCPKKPEGQYWHPDETDMPDRIENDLLELVGQHGNGWAVYTRRLASAGLREYFFYFGGDAELDKVAPALKAKYPEYRIELEAKPDPRWELYLSWIKTAPHE
jgi:hypothetical protein